MEQKDFSLLRPFDLEKAKQGHHICWWRNGDNGKFIHSDRSGNVCIDWAGVEPNEMVVYNTAQAIEHLRMSPEDWVDGKPVYPGDILYTKNNLPFQAIKGHSIPPDLKWEKIVTKKYGWINIYPGNQNSNIHPTREVAITRADKNVIATIRISWKE